MKLLTVAEAAEQLGVSTKTVRRLIDAGNLPAARVGQGRGTWRIDAEDLRGYVEDRKTGVPCAPGLSLVQERATIAANA